jgi:monothiol glutaredoxin
MALNEETRRQIANLIERSDVLLFMKGDRAFPQCGFSNRVVQMLDALVPDYQTVDVLADPEIRDGIKEFSSWPTIPQLYVKGEFVGGCDIVSEMYESGELHQVLGLPAPERRVPTVHVTEKAAAQLRHHAERAPGKAIHLSIDARNNASLGLAPARGGEVKVDFGGVLVLMDPLTAERAEGLAVDFDEGKGFRIDPAEGNRA